MTGNDEKRSLVVKREQFITSLKEHISLPYLKNNRKVFVIPVMISLKSLEGSDKHYLKKEPVHTCWFCNDDHQFCQSVPGLC